MRTPSFDHKRSPFQLATLLLCVGFALHCDRAVEPIDVTEKPRTPDLSRIFPEGDSGGGGMGARQGSSGMEEPARMASTRGNVPARSSEPAGAGAGAPIRGSVQIADSLAADAARDGVLFVIARVSASGPPLAVLRVEDPRFPYAFEIGPANVMIPSMSFAGEIRISARLDSDGNAMTKLPGDLMGELASPVPPGTSGVELELDQRI